MVKALGRQLSDLGMKYAIGGQVCFDSFPAGWDKTYILRHTEAENERSGLVYDRIHFFGDKIQKGENDHEIHEDKRTIRHKVMNPKDTVRQLRELFNL